MKTEPISFRPRDGICVESYWSLRRWCQINGFTFSDIINAILPAYNYYLHNHCKLDKEKSKATVNLMIGEIDILHVFNGKCYPLVSETNAVNKKVLTIEEIQDKINYWHEKNSDALSHSDLLLLNNHAKRKAGTSN